MIAPGEVVLSDLQGVIDDLKDGVLNRWQAKAQKGALEEWRDKPDAPGVKARFTDQGAKAYGFANRSMAYTKGYVVVGGTHVPLDSSADGLRHKGDLPPFVYRGRAGGLMGKVLARKPKTKRNAGAVSTRLSIMGGVLNLLGAQNQRGYRREEARRSVEPGTRGPFTRNTRWGPVQVRQHDFRRVTIDWDIQLADRTYAEEFAVKKEDETWVRRRTDELLLEIYRKQGFTKRGKRKRGAFRVV